MALTRKERILQALLNDEADKCGSGLTREERMLARLAKTSCDNDVLQGVDLTWDDVARGETLYSIKWDGNTDDREVVTETIAEIPLSYYKVSDTYLTADELLGAVMTVSGASVFGLPEEITVAESHITTNFIGGGNPVVAVGMYFPLLYSVPDGNENASQGVYILLAEAEVLSAMFNTTVEDNVYATLVEKYTTVPMPAAYLPDLGLAAVATSGSYNDLSDVPDVLTPTNTAVVARSGNYNDLSNTPCKETTSSSSYITINKFNCWTKKAPSENEFIACCEETAWRKISNGAVVSFSAYKTTNLVFKGEYAVAQKINSNLYWGNASLYNTEYPDTGEDWCVYASETDPNYYVFVYSSAKTPTSLEYSIRTTTVDPLDVKFIPSTIQRVGEPLYLTDPAGAKWQLVVGTDGTLTATEVTE